MADLIVRCVVAIAAFSPIWRRLYIERFWFRGHGTVIQVNVEHVSGDGDGWIFVPTIEYYADGKRWNFQSHVSGHFWNIGSAINLTFFTIRESRGVAYTTAGFIG